MKCHKCGSNKFLSVVVNHFDNLVIKEIRCVRCKEKVILVDHTKSPKE